MLINLKKFDKIKDKQPFTAYKSVCDIPATDIDGKPVKKLGDLMKGKKLIIIANVATKCGHTSKNYDLFKNLYTKYGNKGLEIIVFPCNQFGSQEPGTNQEIKAFAVVRKDAKYKLMDKVNVNGGNAHDVFKFLRYNSELHCKETNTVGHIHWNFGKFLVDPTGQFVHYFPPNGNLEDLEGFVKRVCKD